MFYWVYLITNCSELKIPFIELKNLNKNVKNTDIMSWKGMKKKILDTNRKTTFTNQIITHTKKKKLHNLQIQVYGLFLHHIHTVPWNFKIQTIILCIWLSNETIYKQIEILHARVHQSNNKFITKLAHTNFFLFNF